MMFFTDSGEGGLIQGIQIGSVVAVMAMMLLLIRYLDHPYRDGSAVSTRQRWSGPCRSSKASSPTSETTARLPATKTASRNDRASAEGISVELVATPLPAF